MKNILLLFLFFASTTVYLSAYRNVPPKQDKSVIIEKSSGDNSLQQIPSFVKWGYVYFSLNDFAIKTGFGIYTNESRHKSVLYIGSDKATFTSNNNYVILNDHAYQLPNR